MVRRPNEKSPAEMAVPACRMFRPYAVFVLAGGAELLTEGLQPGNSCLNVFA